MSKLQEQHRIFVVDDEPIITSTLGQILKNQGFQVSCFTNPRKALEAIYTSAPDLLIADVIMPEMSGIDLAIVVREAFPSCTVLLFSGQIATSQLLESARNRGHDFEVLTKPVPPAEILARVCGGLGLAFRTD
jgi:DNA-binding response OmpR family regulator